MNADNPSTDGSSIKPVSSLRSHFEKLTPVKSANAVPTIQQLGLASTHVVAECKPSIVGFHSSLNVPRIRSSWRPADEVDCGQRPISPASKPPAKRIAKVIDPESTLDQQSLSTRQPSLLPKPPIKPESRNQSPTKLAQQVNQTPTPKVVLSSPQEISGGKTSLSSNYNVQQSASQKLPIGKEAGPVAIIPPAIVDCGIRNDVSGPPPISRAEKPKPPSKPPMIHGSQERQDLLLGSRESGGRRPPFPNPSSGVIVDHGSGVPRPFSEAKKSEPPGDHMLPFNRMPFHKGSNPECKSLPDIGSRKTLYGTLSSVESSDEGQRPNLPPRPTKEFFSLGARRNGDDRKRLPTNEQRSTPHSFLPGTQSLAPHIARKNSNQQSTNDHQTIQGEATSGTFFTSDYPDTSRSNRKPPRAHKCASAVETKYDTRLFDACGRYICATGYLTRAWDVTTGELVFHYAHNEKETKVTSIAFKSGGAAEDEGKRLWLGTNYGELYEVDITINEVVQTRPGAHAHREIVKIYRFENYMWSLDDDGGFHIWPPDETGAPNLSHTSVAQRLPKGHTFSIVVRGYLWLATGKYLRVYDPSHITESSFQVTQSSFSQPGAGEITSGAVISSQIDRVYFGHADGKVTIYSVQDYTCIGLHSVSAYKINCMAGAGFYLWAGFNTGMINVYDTRPQPWSVKKDWQAHENPVSAMVVDRTSVWKFNRLHVISMGMDNIIRIWDGLLEEDWLEAEMEESEATYCSFRELSSIVISWNAGATTPSSLRSDEKNNNFFRKVISTSDPPDILVFGFQELVDLDDKRLTAKSLFLGGKKKDSSEHEHMSRQYRAWRDYLVRVVEDSMPPDEPYHLLHTASLVGLFSCVFIKTSHQNHVNNLHAAEVKRGIGGLHGNKGALIIRFTFDDTSLCFTNCHLAAGQSQTVSRNNDIAAILESALLPIERDPQTRLSRFVDGGDGSMIMDHEICILNGDLNYRIDTMGRDTVIKAIKAYNLPKLLERDQLLVSRRRNPGFRLRSFTELPITFAPTYKYDVGTDRYDTSEKSRSPAWCDRLLYRGAGRVTQLDYQRHELRVSDHRPISGNFRMKIKSVVPDKREKAWQDCKARYEQVRKKLVKEIQVDYLVSVLGTNLPEAKRKETSMGLDDWKYRAPYKVHENDPNFHVRYEGKCHCGRVRYQLSRERPLKSKYCHCTTCQVLHGAPFQWAAIFHKEDINFTHGHHDLAWYDSGEKTTAHKLPCKVRCAYCHTPIMDEGRNMILLFPTLLDFKGLQGERENFAPSCHMFYPSRVVDIPDGKPKWTGMDEKSELMDEVEDTSAGVAKKRKMEKEPQSSA